MTRVGIQTHPQPDFSSPYFSSCFKGVLSVFNKSSLLINSAGADVDGWILLGPDSAQVDVVRKNGRPAVIMNGSAEGLPSIDLDNVGAARAVTARLAEQGHRRIGFIAGKSETANAQDRLEGYRQGLNEHGIPWAPDLVIEGRFERAGGQRAMEQFLKLSMPPTAVFAANDHMALGAWEVLEEKQIPVPRQIALAGFDDIPAAETSGLTSVRQPLEDMAALAAVWLKQWIQSDLPPPTSPRFFPGQLHWRASTGGG